MSNQPQDNLPDIDAGLSELSKETTAADLLRQQGQRKKIKVINRNQLKAQIQEWIRKSVEEGVADMAGSLSEEEREAIIRQTEERVQEAMARSQKAEAQRLAVEEEREALEARVNQLADEHNANEDLKRSIQQLQERLQRAELVADESQQDVLAMEQDLENIQKMHQATRFEKERLEETVRNQMRYTGGLVGQVMALDSAYYGSLHQEQNPVPDDADGAAGFYHDFVVGEKVLETLSSDLVKLREISAKAEQEPPTKSEPKPQLLAQDLALLEQLKSGSLNAVELAAPVENLVEALDGARSEVMNLQHASAADAQVVEITALPAEDGDPAEVLQGATHVVRELTAALAAARGRLDGMSGQGAESERAKQALRENMKRTTQLVQGVLELDNSYYGGRHQEANPVTEDGDAAAEELFYHDFDVGAQVIGTLSADLQRLRDLTKDEAKYSGLLDSDLALLEQLKAGSLNAVEMAAPVENLIEAVDGARNEVMGLQEASAGAGQVVQITAVPAEDGDPAEVLQGATHVLRELTAALAAARARVGALAGQEAERERAKQALRENMKRTTQLVQGVLELDSRHYGGRHQEENPVAEDGDGDGQEVFYHDFDVGAQVIATLSSDLERLSDLTKDEAKYSGMLGSDLELLEQLKAGSLQAMDVAAPVANLIEALDGARSEASSLHREADEALNLPMGQASELSALPDPDGPPSEVLAGATTVARELATALATERKRLQALRALADEADAARQEGEQELEGARRLLASIAEQANDFGVDCPPALADESADSDQRVAAAQQVLDALHGKLEQEAAAVDELSTTLEAALGDESPEIAAAPQADDQHGVLAALKAKVDHLGEAYQRMRADYVASRARETALADQLQALVRDLEPELANDQSSEVAAELGKVEQALAEQQASADQPAAATSQGAAELGSALARLVSSMRQRASAGAIGGTPTAEVEALAREVLEAARADDDVSGHELTVDLAMGLDAEADDKPSAKDLLNTSKQVIEVLSARRVVLAEDLSAAVHAKDRLERTVHELEQRVTELNGELEGERTGKQAALAEASSKAETELTALKTELDDAKEALLSGKEIIAHLNEKDQRHAAELETLKGQHEQLQEEVRARATRLVKAEAANRQLSETLSEVSQALLQQGAQSADSEALEEARVELEVALSELPAEDSGDVPVREDIADDLAAAGAQVLERIRARELALNAQVGELEAGIAELQQAKAAAEAASESVRAETQQVGEELGRAEARIGALHQELEETNQALAAKGKELGQAREQLATTKVELEAAQRRSEEHEETIAALQADTSEADKVRAELEQLRGELQTAYDGERELAQALNRLAGWSGEVVGEYELQAKAQSKRYTRSRDKLEKAVEASESGGQASINLIERSKEMAEQVQGQAALITEHLREQREKIGKLYADNDAIQGRVSTLEAGAADKDYQLSQAREQLEQLRAELEGVRGEIESAQTEASRQKDLLRQAKAALDEYKAREGEHAGGVEGQVQKLREDLDQERSGREAAEERLAQVKEDLESTIAGLRARAQGLDQRIAERDEEILKLQAQLDEELSQRLDTAEGKARLQGLQSELESERALRAELERQLDEFKGGVGQEVSKAQKSRSELMERLRKLEGELGEERGKAQALKTSKESLRKDLAGQMDKIRAQLTAEREAKEQLESSERHLREELAGLRARLRTLTSTDEDG